MYHNSVTKWLQSVKTIEKKRGLQPTKKGEKEKAGYKMKLLQKEEHKTLHILTLCRKYRAKMWVGLPTE